MFEALLWAAMLITALALFCALDGSRDVFHLLVSLVPMMAFLYAWMPLRLLPADGLARFFDEQLMRRNRSTGQSPRRLHRSSDLRLLKAGRNTSQVA